MCHWLLLLGSIGYTGDSGMVAMGPMVIAVLCALVVGAAVTRIVLSVTRRFDWLDRPNVRSAHKRPTPTAGGIGIVAGFWAGGAVAVWEGVWSGVEWWGLLGATALLLLAVIDDVVRPMRPPVQEPARTARSPRVRDRPSASYLTLDRSPCNPSADGAQKRILPRNIIRSSLGKFRVPHFNPNHTGDQQPTT